ncbi:putative Ig domain-containing protein [Cellulomonas sp. NPDC089187]|uniref:putative Ig domain-containing protein n=1 Tax=Cellulomonas sp. NPDC089187 TaxID=3154970 RepID=UPI0034403240
MRLLRPLSALLTSILVVLGLVAPSAAANTGTLSVDPAFDQRVGTALNGLVRDADALGPNGIVVGGAFTSPNPYLARYRADGSPDTEFNARVGGMINGPVNTVLVDPKTGAITVGGEFTEPNTHLMRLHADGTPDTAFNAAVAGLLDAAVQDLHLADDGALTVAGIFTSAGNRIVRLTADGSVDETFSIPEGIEFDRFSLGGVLELDVDPVTGQVTATAAGNGVVRFTADGAVDPSFLWDADMRGAAGDMHVNHATGQITQANPTTGLRVGRFNADGTRDTAFNDTVRQAQPNGQVAGLYVEPSGDFYLSGEFTSPSTNVARYHADGTPDEEFNAAMRDSTSGYIRRVRPDSSGAILLAGQFTTSRASGLARVRTPSVSLDPVADQSSPQGTAIAPLTVTAATSGDAMEYTATGLPAGLTIDAATGVITGTPTEAGTTTVTVTARGAGVEDSVSFDWTIVLVTAPTLTGAPPQGTVSAAYDYLFALTGDPQPTVSVSAGTLPEGLVLDADGRLHGTPTTAGSWTIELQAENAGGVVHVATTLTIVGPELWVAHDEVLAGESQTVTGTGFAPGEEIAVELHSTPVEVGIVTANAAGEAELTFTVPADTSAGPHRVVTLSAAGETSAQFQVISPAVVTPSAPPAAPTPSVVTAPATSVLAVTGGMVTGVAVLAAAALLGGLVLLRARRRSAQD